MRYCAAVDATSSTWSSANLPSSRVRLRRRLCHRQVKLSRTWPSDERVEAHAGTRSVIDALLDTAFNALPARWECTGGLSAAIWRRRRHRGTIHQNGRDRVA